MGCGTIANGQMELLSVGVTGIVNLSHPLHKLVVIMRGFSLVIHIQLDCSWRARRLFLIYIIGVQVIFGGRSELIRKVISDLQYGVTTMLRVLEVAAYMR